MTGIRINELREGGWPNEHSNNQQKKLDAKLHNITRYHRKWKDQSGKIDLAKNSRIGNESIGSGIEARGKIIPDGDATHVKQYWNYPIGGNLCYVRENDHKNYRRK
jgi:hypothetical protein